MSNPTRRDLLKAGAALAAPALWGPHRLAAAEAPDPYGDAVLVDGPPPELSAGSFTVAVLPDTQNYSEYYPALYAAQTKWIVEHQAARNIACVLHLGDVTNHAAPAEWDNAVAAMRTLDGHVPYFLVPGNHDYSRGGSCEDRTTLLSKYFPVASFRDRPTFGGTYDKEPQRIENSYHTFTAEGRRFLVVALEFGPRRDVVRWANDVVARHHDHEAILITHAYMYYDDTRYDWQSRGNDQTWNPHSYPVARNTSDDVTDGEGLWTKLVSQHENFIMTLNGHVLQDGLGRLTSATPGGRDVHQMLVNFQMRPQGGDGWLRLLEFRPDGKTVQVYDYSPTRNQRNESQQNQFMLTWA
ncbi:MAG: metallophosphoesterase [Planctomycetales bacterium]|nr:metallophosphoesterase [Planctomycetales bacterium]